MASADDDPAPTQLRMPRRPATEAEARALGSTVRMRILRLCLDDALTNKEIAGQLERDPASVLHHVRRLVDTGFLEALPARRGTRGAREVPYRSTGKSWRLSSVDLPGIPRPGDIMLRTFLEELADAGGDIVDSARLGLRLNAEHRTELTERLGAVLDEFAARPPDQDGEHWSFYFALHADRRRRTPQQDG
jgi:DNA-binding transcriptional ArsR family regulator